MKVPAVVAALVVAAPLALSGVAGAEPGPNGHNDYGLCKAYFAGSDTGKEHKRSAPPFAALEEAAGGSEEDVAEFCESVTPGGK